MGTSGITHFHNGDLNDPVICHVYKQSDGYPDSLGQQIKDCLGDASLVNGIREFDTKQVNGPGCAAARFIADVKEDVGGIYMIADAPDWSDFDYDIFFEGDRLRPEQNARLSMRVRCGDQVLWQGKIPDFKCEDLLQDEHD